MWIWLAFLSIPVVIIILRRNNSLMRTLLERRSSMIGVQLGDHIYTLTSDIYTDGRLFDVVYMRRDKEKITGYRILHREPFTIYLEHIPVGHRLVYRINGEIQKHLYMEGSPFEVNDGELILYKRKRKGMGFISEEVARSSKWPIKK